MMNVEYINKVDNIYTDNSSSILEIPELSYFDGEQYDIYDTKDYARFIADIERVVRNSFEYRQLIQFLSGTEGMNKCSFCDNVSNVDSKKVRVEIHHAPYTLADITYTVTKKRLHMRESIDIFDIANEILWLHYMGFVGLYPVGATTHELIHNGYLFVPTYKVRGQYKVFTEIYYDFIDPDTLDALDNLEKLSEECRLGESTALTDQMRIFNIHQTYLRFKNLNQTQYITQGRDTLRDRIDDIKKNKKVMYRLIKPVKAVS